MNGAGGLLAVPRVPLGIWPTPLHPAPRLSAELGVEVWFKRDDLTGFGLGQLLHYGRELNAMDQVIGIMAVIVFIGLLADKVLFSPWENFLHRRWGTSK